MYVEYYINEVMVINGTRCPYSTPRIPQFPSLQQVLILQKVIIIKNDGNDNPVYETAKETQMYRTVFWTLWERERWDDLGEWH